MKKIRIFPILLLLCLVFTVFTPSAFALDDPELHAQAALLVNVETGEILYRKNETEQRSPASLTKIMTVLLAVEAVERGEISMDDVVTAGLDCQTGLDTDSSNVSIVAGEQMTLRDLLYCAMVASANEACNVIASYVSGSISAFVDRMNERAAELGCTGTHFADPNGLSNENHYTTAYDLYLITREAISHPDFMTICNTATYQVPATNATEERNLNNSNALINTGGVYGSGYLYEYAAGVKTGYTRLAGYCLISTAEKDGVHVLAVVLGSGGYYTGAEDYENFVDSIALYNWVFNNFSYQEVLSAADPVQKVSVELASGDGNAILRARSDVTLLLPNDVDPASRTLQVTLYEDRLTAPIKAGTVLGQAVIEIGGKSYGPIELVTNVDIGMAKSQYLRQQLQEFFSRVWVRTVIILLIVILVVYVLLVARYRALRRKHLREKRRAEKRRRAAQQQQPARKPVPKVKEPTQRFTAIDPNERDGETFDLDKYFDDHDWKA